MENFHKMLVWEEKRDEVSPGHCCFLKPKLRRLKHGRTWENGQRRHQINQSDSRRETLPNNLVHKLDQLLGDITCVT